MRIPKTNFKQQFILSFSPKTSFWYIYNCASNTWRVGRQAHMEREKQKPTLFITKQCWSPTYKVPVLFTCGGCCPEGFIAASFYNFKYILTIMIMITRKMIPNFNLHNFYFPVSIFLCQFSFFAKWEFFWTAAWSALDHYLRRSYQIGSKTWILNKYVYYRPEHRTNGGPLTPDPDPWECKDETNQQIEFKE